MNESVINNKALVKTLFIAAAIMMLLNVANELSGRSSWIFNRFFNGDLEANFPTWFSSVILVIASFFAYKCSLIANRQPGEQLIWRIFSIGLLGMSCDEVVSIHETIEVMSGRHFNITHNWSTTVGPFILFAIIVFAFRLRRYLKGSTRARFLLFVGAMVYIGGAFMLESTNTFLDHDTFGMFFRVESVVEETCEMLGAIVIIKGLIEHYKYLLRRNTNNG